MGCDGGTIPRRDELVRVKKKPEQKDKDSEREFLWLHCALSQQRLQEPIVMCSLGRLYSKQTVIEHLLEKDKMPQSAMHIKSMKDIKTLNLTTNPAYTAEDKTEGLLDVRHSPYICKLIGLEMSGKFRFIAIWTCGCVMSERGFKQIKSANCPLCQTSYEIQDVIVLNGSDEDIELMKVKVEMRNAKRKAKKKEKSSAKANTAATSTLATVNIFNNGNDIPHKVPNATVVSTSTKESSTSSGRDDASVFISKDVPKHLSKEKLLASTKRSSTETSLQDPDIKRLRNNYSVAKDPKATDVYKSLFTSHKSEQEQTRAHWVTYNPFYN